MALFVCFYKDVWEGLQCVIIHNNYYCSLPCTVQTRMLRHQLLAFHRHGVQLQRHLVRGVRCWMAALTQDGFVLAMQYGSHPTLCATSLCNLYCRSSSNVKALHVNTGEHHNNYTTQGILIIILDYQFLDIYEFLSKPCRDIDCYLLTKYLVL